MCVIGSCVKVLWVKVGVCVCVEEGVEKRRQVQNEDGEVPGSHMSGPDTGGCKQKRQHTQLGAERWPQAHKGQAATKGPKRATRASPVPSVPPATQNARRCRQVPHLRRKVKVHVANCHACHRT